MNNPAAMQQAAVRYASAGWPVFPLHDTTAGQCSCSAGPECRHGGRHPRTPNGFHDATIDPTRAGLWWARWPHANLGVATGARSGLLVVDLDGPAGIASWEGLVAEHGDQAETAVVATPHGTHRWYRLPSDVTVARRIRVLDGVDVLGDRGYAVVPPSIVTCSRPRHDRGDRPCGSDYVWTARGRLDRAPEWLVQLTDEHAHELDPHVDPVAGHQGSYGEAALRGEAERVARASIGKRNDTLNLAAWRLGRLVAGGELDAERAVEALRAAARSCGLLDDDGETQITRTISSGLNAGMREPRARPRRPDLRRPGGRSPAL